MKILVLPIAGKSSRFDNMRPKWMLCAPNGKLMITESISGVDPKQFDKIVVIGLKEHADKYIGAFDAVKKEIENTYVCIVNVALIESSKNQPDTVYQGLNQLGITNGSIFIKDCDNYFETDVSKLMYNSVVTMNLNRLDTVKASNKSYILRGENSTIVNIAEKKIISNEFCCGGYYFADVNQYYKYYEILQDEDNLYISHIIYKMILNKNIFFVQEAYSYIDWGTKNDWLEWTSQFQTLFIDIDGVIVNNSAGHFEPKWGTTEGIKENVEYLKELYTLGKTYIILTTARTEEYRTITEEQLKKIGMPYDRLIMDLPHTKRILINDFSTTNPYPSAVAVNLKRNSNNLKELMGE